MGTYASRGQARTVALALRLAEAAYLSTLRGDGPIVLLDDVLSELDARRRAQVLRRASSYEQVIITTTDLEPLGEEFLRGATCFQVSAGQVTPLQSV
jgi:DNA replication and repair protein RecF